MGRAPCCDKANVKKGPWSPEEDEKLKEYMEKFGTGGNWIALPQKAGLRRCGKSCRLRWLNYLRPNIKHGEFSDEEDRIICRLYANIGSRWSIIAAQLPGRTDNDIKNYWNTKLKKKLMGFASNSSHKIIRPLNHHHNHHQITANLFYPQISSLISSSPYSNTTTNFQCYESSTIPSNFLNAAASCTPGISASTSTHHVLQIQESYVGPTTTTTSSSDGSCTNYQISQGLRDDYGGDHQNLDFQSYIFNNGINEDGEKPVIINGNDGCYVEQQINNPLDYSLEEIKQLISTNNSNSKCNNLFLDENKTEEKVMMYYY